MVGLAVLLSLWTGRGPAGRLSQPPRALGRAVPGRRTDRHAVAHPGRQAGRRWGQSVVIENKGGASGAIGSDFAAKSAPDGYTDRWARRARTAPTLIFFPNLPYDPIKDFQPLTLIGTACMALVTAPSVPASTPKELVEWIRSRMAA